MSIKVEDIQDNYNVLKNILFSEYEKINGFDFYRYIFPDNELKGDLNDDYSKPNAIYLYQDERDIGSQRRVRRRIMLNDTWEDDYMEYVEDNSLTFCSGLSYRGRTNRLEKAQHMNAMVFDLDGVGENELLNLFLRIGKSVAFRTLPQPTFIAMSGTGLHIYYVFNAPIELFPNIKLQLKRLKYDLTFRLWDYKGTSQQKQIQYQSINQGFRMVGSINNKYNLPVIAFKTGDKVDLDYLNQYVIEEKNKVDINMPFRPTKYTLKEAQEKFPDWYQRVVIKGNKNQNKWHIKKDLYYWWLKQIDKVKGGHRYFYLMCLVIYAVKCDVPKKEVKKDMLEVFDYLANIEHTNPLTKEDINSALEVYDRAYYNFTIEDIEKLTDIRIERNKRNYRTQDLHLKIARSTLKIMNEEKNKTLQGRPKNSTTKEKIIRNYILNNPDDNPTQIAKALKISRPTVYKYR